MAKIFFFFLFFPFTMTFGINYELAICAIFHNEARFLKDWLDFHLAMGVEHFYLYNHQSTDDFEEAIRTYVERGLVDLINWDFSYENIAQWNHIQCSAYNDGLGRFKTQCKWVAFLDIDEYLYSPTGQLLPVILNTYSKCGAVSANWVFYGTSGIYELDPTIPFIFQFIYRAPFEYDAVHHVKSIVMPFRVKLFVNPHYPILNNNYHQVTENLKVFSGPFSPSFSAKKIRINHYWSRDEKFFYDEKTRRQCLWSDSKVGSTLSPSLNSIADTEICEIFMSLQ